MSDGRKSKLDFALEYVSHTWPVYPAWWIENEGCSCGGAGCDRPSKHPIPSNGFHSATTDLEAIHQWWTDLPNANIGVRTGPESGIFVFDVDGPAGLEHLSELEAVHGPLPKTVSVLTGGGGVHYYFAYPSGIEITGKTRLSGKKLDVQGAKGCVIGAGSDHLKGEYRWGNSPVVLSA